MLRMTNAVSATDRKLIASLRLVFETEVAISAAKIDEYKAKNPELADAIQTLNDELTKKKLQKHQQLRSPQKKKEKTLNLSLIIF